MSSTVKNILLIVPYGGVGGMERLVHNFYKHYKKQGNNLKVLKFIKLNNDLINFEEDELFLKPYDFGSMSRLERIMFYFKSPLRLRKIIKKHNVTHSIAFGDMANLFSSLTFTKEFKVGSIHALKSVELKNKTLFNKIVGIGYRTSYRHLDKLVCISKAIKEDLRKNCGYRFNNMEIIYNPHNIEDIITQSNEPITDKSELEIFEKEVVLFLGRLSLQKSPWHLVKAFSILRKSHKDVNLVLMGDGDSRVLEHLKLLIAKLDLDKKVFLIGRRSNPYKYIKSSKLLALSSHYEGTPNVIVEAIAVGTPIVSSNCTDGILELMSLTHHNESQENIVTESGVVTPNLFDGQLGIPETDEILQRERDFADAMYSILRSNIFKVKLEQNRAELLSKFNLVKVASKYMRQ
ncbi:glycosyltransferase [Flavobacteriaceae bacterium 3-367]